MKVLFINSVCGIGSTGRICTDLAQQLEAEGNEVRIAYGRKGTVPEQFQKYAVRIGTDWDCKMHAIHEKLGRLARERQIICITHLPQIAAMADEHFLIEKNVKENRTRTDIVRLKEEDSIRELSRLLGSGDVTEATRLNAVEMKKTAETVKNSL